MKDNQTEEGIAQTQIYLQTRKDRLPGESVSSTLVQGIPHTHTHLPHKAWAAKRCSLIGFLAVMDTRGDWLKNCWDNLPYRDLFSRHRMNVAKNISAAQRSFEKPSSLSKIFLILVGLPHQFLFLFALFLSQLTLFQQLTKNAIGRAKE